jgi:hypothetical protein
MKTFTGENAEGASRTIRSQLWRCPRCGHRFTSRNLPHSCGRFRLTDHFKGRPDLLRQTFRQFVSVARGFGPTTVYAQKTRIVLQHRVRFASVMVRRDYLDAGLWLRRRRRHPLLMRTEALGRAGFYVHLRLADPGDITHGVVKLLKEAYSAGPEHERTLKRNRPDRLRRQ